MHAHGAAASHQVNPKCWRGFRRLVHVARASDSLWPCATQHEATELTLAERDPGVGRTTSTTRQAAPSRSNAKMPIPPREQPPLRFGRRRVGHGEGAEHPRRSASTRVPSEREATGASTRVPKMLPRRNTLGHRVDPFRDPGNGSPRRTRGAPATGNAPCRYEAQPHTGNEELRFNELGEN